jgi:hypothetical protein
MEKMTTIQESKKRAGSRKTKSSHMDEMSRTCLCEMQARRRTWPRITPPYWGMPSTVGNITMFSEHGDEGECWENIWYYIPYILFTLL